MAPLRPKHFRFSHGFSLVELVVVIVLLGILSAYVAPKIDFGGTEGRNFVDNALISMRYAQKLAVAQHRDAHVCFTTTSLQVGFGAGCASLATDPGGGTINTSSTNVSISPTSEIVFDFEGTPNAGHTVNFTVGSETYAIIVEAHTGYVHR